MINQCFNESGRRYIHIGKTSAIWSRARGKDNNGWNASELIGHINYLIDNIYFILIYLFILLYVFSQL